MTPSAVKEALEELVDELVGRGVPARLTIYGGAAISLVHYERASTGDIDASFFPRDDVLSAAAVVGKSRGLRDDWLNSAAEQFLPPIPDDKDRIVIDRGGVTVAVGSAKLLLAMKLRASRPGRDADDIAVLVRACNVRSVREAEAVMDGIYLGEEEISARGLALLERAFGEVEIVGAEQSFILPAIGSDEPGTRGR